MFELNRHLSVVIGSSGEIEVKKDENDSLEDFETFVKSILKDVNKTKETSTYIEQRQEKTDNCITFKKAIDNFYEYRKSIKRPLSDKLKVKYETTFKYLFLFVDQDTCMESLDVSFFFEFRTKMTKLPKNFIRKYSKDDIDLYLKKELSDKEKLSNSSINDMMGHLRLFYDAMISQGILKITNPVNIQPLLKKPKSEKFGYEEKELNLIVSELYKISKKKYNEKQFYHLVLFALYTGCRLGEILSIKKRDIDENNFIVIMDNNTDKEKKGKSENAKRRIYIQPKISFIIEEQKRINKGEKLFFEKQSSKISDYVNTRIRKVIPTKEKSFHSFRKNCIQKMFDMNIEEWKIKKAVGHSTKDVTQRHYNNRLLSEQETKEVFEKISYDFENLINL